MLHAFILRAFCANGALTNIRWLICSKCYCQTLDKYFQATEYMFIYLNDPKLRILWLFSSTTIFWLKFINLVEGLIEIKNCLYISKNCVLTNCISAIFVLPRVPFTTSCECDLMRWQHYSPFLSKASDTFAAAD